MPTSGVLWNQIAAEATAQADRVGIPEKTERYNAFFHVYVSARLVQLVGETGAFISGSGLELKNHWDYREHNPNDPNHRRDRFRDLWNNAVGREIGKIGVFNKWSPDQIAEYSKNAVIRPIGPHAQPVAIVNILNQVTDDDPHRDSRIKEDFNRFSTFDYLFGSDYPSTSDIHSVAPPGTMFPPPSPSIGSNSASYRVTPNDLRTVAPTVEPSRGGTIRASLDTSSDRMRDLEGLMGDRHSEYWRGPKADTLQQEYRDLIEAKHQSKERESGFSTLAGLDAGLDADLDDKAITERLNEIQSLMGGRDSEYWSGPRSDALQQEFRDLLELQNKKRIA